MPGSNPPALEPDDLELLRGILEVFGDDLSDLGREVIATMLMTGRPYSYDRYVLGTRMIKPCTDGLAGPVYMAGHTVAVMNFRGPAWMTYSVLAAADMILLQSHINHCRKYGRHQYDPAPTP